MKTTAPGGVAAALPFWSMPKNLKAAGTPMMMWQRRQNEGAKMPTAMPLRGGCICGSGLPGLRLGRRLYDARKELCETLNLKSIIFGGRFRV
ncbi:MAG: hypothetical protein R2860_06770 [Desulfobacterales bacterium]